MVTEYSLSHMCVCDSEEINEMIKRGTQTAWQADCGTAELGAMTTHTDITCLWRYSCVVSQCCARALINPKIQVSDGETIPYYTGL